MLKLFVIILQQGETWNGTLVLDPIIKAPGILKANNATVDMTTGSATFKNVTASAAGSYPIRVDVKSSSGSYSVLKRSVLRVIASPVKEVVKKSVQLTFAANFALISGKHEFFQATLENHFYEIFRTDQVIFSNFDFKQGKWQYFMLWVPAVVLLLLVYKSSLSFTILPPVPNHWW